MEVKKSAGGFNESIRGGLRYPDAKDREPLSLHSPVIVHVKDGKPLTERGEELLRAAKDKDV